MALPLAQRKHYYNSCDPDLPLDPHDERNVDIDARGANDGLVRGEPWAAKLAREVEFANRPVCLFFSGLRGSGKSTELRRLAERLSREDPDCANLLPVLIDAEEVIDLRAPIDVPDLLIAVLYEADRVVSMTEGKGHEDVMKDGPARRLWNWLTRTDVELTKVEAGLSAEGASAKLVADLKTRPTLRERVRRTVAENLAAFLAQVESEFRELERRAQAKGRTSLVIILDSLEKLQGTSESFEAVLNSAERVFANGAPYLRLPVHVIYTVPPPMIVRMATDEVRFLPMIKLRTRDRKPFADGVAAAREIIRRRVPDAALAELFGAETAEDRVRAMIEWSGGYPRELMRLLQSMLTLDPLPASERAFHSELNRAGDTYGRVVNSNGQRALDLLARVYLTQRLVIDDSERVLADRLLSGNLILRYLNDDEWADVHPALLKMNLLQEAIARQKLVLAAPWPAAPPVGPAQEPPP